jgi:hypothetical protein
MPSIRETAVSAGLRAGRRFSGSPVVYSRGSVSLSVDHAVKRSEDFVTLDQSGNEQIITAVVWRIPLVELESVGDPEIGDTITDDCGTVFTVESPGSGVLHWRNTDVGKSEVTVFTRQNGFHEVTRANQRDLAGNEVRRT